MIKRALLVLCLLFSFLFAGGVFAGPAAALDPLDDACKGQAQNSAVCDENRIETISGEEGILYKVTRVVAIIAGIAAVIIMIVGGLMFITADGDASKVTNARNTVLYAAIGLVVIALAQSIITLVVRRL